MPDILYKRVTRSGPRGGFFTPRAFQSRGSLWLGPDHLLCLESTGYSENYKRFYFQDIQAIVVQRTKVFQILNVIIGVMALAVLLLTFALLSDAQTGTEARAVVLGIILGVFVTMFLVNFILGPSCKTYLRTAVQIEDLPSLNRIKRTRRALAKIRPLIITAQGGEIPAETLSASMRQWSEPVPATAAPDTVASASNVPVSEPAKVWTPNAAPNTVAEDPNAPPRLNS